MDLRQRWLLARQDPDADWEFFADRGRWSRELGDAVLFHALWGAEEAHAHNAAAQSVVRNAADVYDFVATRAGETMA